VDYTGFAVCTGEAWQQLGSIMGFLSTPTLTHTQTNTHTHTHTLISPQTSRLAVTKQSTHPVLAVRGKLQPSSTSPHLSAHKGQGRKDGEGGRDGERERGGEGGSAPLDRDKECCGKAGGEKKLLHTADL